MIAELVGVWKEAVIWSQW